MQGNATNEPGGVELGGGGLGSPWAAMSVLWLTDGCWREVCEFVVYFPKILSNTLSYGSPYFCKLPQSKSVHTIESEYRYLILPPQS